MKHNEKTTIAINTILSILTEEEREELNNIARDMEKITKEDYKKNFGKEYPTNQDNETFITAVNLIKEALHNRRKIC